MWGFHSAEYIFPYLLEGRHFSSAAESTTPDKSPGITNREGPNFGGFESMVHFSKEWWRQLGGCTEIYIPFV